MPIAIASADRDPLPFSTAEVLDNSIAAKSTHTRLRVRETMPGPSHRREPGLTTDPAPIVLIGAARSGTKFVRDVLAADGSFACVPYDVNYVWRMGARTDHDVLDPATLDDRGRRRIRDALDRLARRRQGDSRRLVEKTVSNTLRVPYVDAVFPDAVYVHLVRDGHAVIESAMRLWRTPPDTVSLRRKLSDMSWSNAEYAAWFAWNHLRGRFAGRAGGEVWGPRYPGIFQDVAQRPLIEVVARQWVESVTRASDDLAALGAGRVHTVTYEALMTNPMEIERLCDFLDVRDRDAVIKRFAASVDRGNLDTWQGALSDEDLEVVRRVAGETIRRYCDLRQP